jgi:uncharacterized protein YcsI (UPF0317 family)
VARVALAMQDAATPAGLRRVDACGSQTEHTVGLAPGYTRANHEIRPVAYASNFL